GTLGCYIHFEITFCENSSYFVMVAAMAKRYEGQIKHDSDTIRRLFKAEYDTYEMKRVVLRFFTGGILAAAGAAIAFPMAVKAILMMVGCWLLVSRDFPARCRADKTLEQRKTALPVIKTTFFDDRVLLDGEGKMNIKYHQFEAIVEEGNYYFLFLGRGSACMIAKDTLKPDSQEEFKEFLAKKTGLEWRQNKSLLRMTIRDVRRLFQSPGKKKTGKSL
ncbi:MAG: YcxB family protein, partial [Eubacteriales bacterium]|nr:YcxB family protein [Eubacteriales bacterium]